MTITPLSFGFLIVGAITLIGFVLFQIDMYCQARKAKRAGGSIKN